VSRALRFLLVALVFVGVCAAVVYVAYPELVLRALSGSARRSAGLDRRVIEVGGHRIVYLDGGSGPTVVLLHGFGANKDLWNGVAAELTPKYRVIAPDLPGFGESSIRETERYDAERQAALVRSFLDALSVRDHHLGGNSMGGSISAVYAATYPKAVSSLLIGAAPGVRSSEKSDFERRLGDGENPMLMRDEDDFDTVMELAFFRPPSIPGPLKRAMLAIAIRNQAAYARIFDDFARAGEGALEPLLSRIAARTLVVWGAGDRIVHPSCPDLLARRYLTFLESGP
jgi:pimeloyl-ACP methyl ester carboxylesterase